MKNILVKVILILLMIVFVFVYYDRNNEHFISDYEDLYEIALSYIKEEEIQIDNKDKDQFGYHAFYNYDKLGITEDNDYQYVYMWILSDNYYYSDEPILSSGYSIFHKFTFKDNKVIKYEIPEDGSYYKKSIKRMCNNTIIYNKVINYTSNMSNDEQITNYYNNLKESMKIKQGDIVDKNGLLFTISWENADCVTVSLSVYDNKTYKLFTNYEGCKKGDTCTDILKYSKSETGKYNYDVIEIIHNSINADGMSFNNYNLPEYEIYTGKNDKVYMMITDSNNIYLNEFLKSINVDLHKCAIPDYK